MTTPLHDKTSTTPLTVKRIIDAALAIVDEQGLKALSMRKLADRLGVKAMSLYNHISNKEALIDALMDRVIDEMAVPDTTQEWKAAMHERARTMHEAILRHPWAAQLMMSRMNTGPAMLTHIDTTLACLRHAGFSVEDADKAWSLMDSHILGFTTLALNAPIQPEQYAQVASDFLPLLSTNEYPYLHELAQTVAAGQYSGINDLDYGLTMILTGLQMQLDRAED